MAGFKNYESKGIPVAAQERVDLHEIQLSVGDVTSTVEVLASAVHVATIAPTVRSRSSPADRRHPDARTQSAVADHDPAGCADPRFERLPRLVGWRRSGHQRRADRPGDHQYGWRRSQDSGNLNPGYISPSVDAIGEVKLLVSNYTAEYGGAPAAS